MQRACRRGEVQRIHGTGEAWDAGAVKRGMWWWARLEGKAQVRPCRPVEAT